jgi:peptidylprolyl isomerase
VCYTFRVIQKSITMSNTLNALVAVAILALIAGGFYMYSHKPMNDTTNMQPITVTEPNPAAPTEIAPAAASQTLPGGLVLTDTKMGTGRTAASGQTVAMHYTGYLTDGTKFDSSLDRGQPFVFTLGAGQVIKGWDQGIVGMKEGGKRTLVIPADLGYGAKGFPPVIPANATLKFDVEFIAVADIKQ